VLIILPSLYEKVDMEYSKRLLKYHHLDQHMAGLVISLYWPSLEGTMSKAYLQLQTEFHTRWLHVSISSFENPHIKIDLLHRGQNLLSYYTL
jgi:hypothetical protein